MSIYIRLHGHRITRELPTTSASIQAYQSTENEQRMCWLTRPVVKAQSASGRRFIYISGHYRKRGRCDVNQTILLNAV
jgi:hypothetical protein